VIFYLLEGGRFSFIVEKAKYVNFKLIIIEEPWEMDFVNNGNKRSYMHTINSNILPDPALLNKISKNFDSLGSKLFIHARMGDYKTWQSGKYYYTHEQYLELLEKNKKNFNFIYVIGNEWTETFENNIIEAGGYPLKGDAIDDFLSLFFADKIIGPPSTFSILARQMSIHMKIKNKIDLEIINKIN